MTARGVTEQATSSFHLSDVLARWWLVLLIASIFGAGVGFVAGHALDPVFETKVDVLVGPVVADSDVLRGSADLARTYGDIVETDQVLQDAAAAAGIASRGTRVSAAAGRGSATLSIVVDATSRDDVIALADAVVARLEAIVRGARPLPTELEQLPSDGAGNVNVSEVIRSGSTLEVLDDGSNNVVDKSLGAPVSAAAGALAMLMLVGSAATTLDRRRLEHPNATSVAASVGFDLGEFVLPPRWIGALQGNALAVNPSPACLDIGLVVWDRVRPTEDGGLAVVFVAATGDDRDHLRVLFTLAAGMPEPPLVLDPNHVLFRVMPADYLLRGIVHELRLDSRVIARAVAPRLDQLDGLYSGSPERARDICEHLSGSSSVVLVFVPADARHVGWRSWAAAADHALLLTSPSDATSEEPLVALAARVHEEWPGTLDVVRSRRPILLGLSTPIHPVALSTTESRANRQAVIAGTGDLP